MFGFPLPAPPLAAAVLATAALAAAVLAAAVLAAVSRAVFMDLGSFALLPLAAACPPFDVTGPGEYAGLSGSCALGVAGNIVCRLLRPSTDSTMPVSEPGSTGSWRLEKKVLAPSR